MDKKLNFQELEKRVLELERALEKSEERLHYFTEASFESIFFSEKGVCIEQNPAAEKMFGYTSEEAIGRSGTDWIAAESKDLVMNNMLEKVNLPYEAIAERKDGSTFPARIHAKKMQYKGRPVRVTSVRDITDFKTLEKDLRNRETRFRLIAQTTNDIFYELIVKTGQQKWFGEIDAALGYQKGEIEHTQDGWLNIIHPDDAPSLDETVRIHKNSTEPINFEYRVICKDGTIRYWHDHSMPILGLDNKPDKWVGGISDITHKKQAELENIELQSKLYRAQKMESLGLLAGGVAHDLNNILSGIVSYPELILLDLPVDSKFRKPIETIQQSGYRATAIVHDLLTVARGVANTKEPVNLNVLITDYLKSPEFKKLDRFHTKIQIGTNLDIELSNIYGSSIHLKKIVMNLVANASEAIEENGNVTILTSNRYIDKPLKGYDDVKVGEYAVLSISDDGLGISEGDFDRIFEPFYSKKVMGRSGTGLGLAVVWNVVQDHHGYIDVKSDVNGTIFDLYFPITRDNSRYQDLAMPIGDYKGNGETILIVDDFEDQRVISCKMLNALGYKTMAVPGGEAAVEYLMNNHADLILLDMIMEPGMNGLETYKRVKEIRPNQKAIIVSGYAESEEVKAVQKMGASKYIRKPFSLHKIGIAVKDELVK